MNQPDKSLVHIFLFAKYHYKVELPIVDAIRVLVAERCGIDFHFIDRDAIHNVLFQCLDQIVGNDSNRIFRDFIERFYSRRVPLMAGYDDNSDEARYNFFLNIISLSKVVDILFPISKDDWSQEIHDLLEKRRESLTPMSWNGLGWKFSPPNKNKF